MNAAAAVEKGGLGMTEEADTKTYRGRTLDEVIQRVKAELGPDAIITRQRDGLTGGVGGFFQKQCVEVEARPGQPAAKLFDAYDEAPGASSRPVPGADPGGFSGAPGGGEVEWEPLAAPDAATEEGLASRAIQAMIEQAAPFADHLTHAERSQLEPAADPGIAQQPAPRFEPAPPARPAAADAVEGALTRAGIDPQLAATLVAETVSHVLPFASPRSLKRLVRAALARHIPTEPGARGRGRSLALVGPGGAGKTLCVARLASAYAAGSELPVVCLSLRPSDGGAELAELLAPARVTVRAVGGGDEARAHLTAAAGQALVVLDTPAVAPKSDAGVAELAAELRTIGLDEIHLALPATFSGPAAGDLATRLEPLGATRIALTHTDESSHVGGIVDMAIRSRTPFSYLSGGTGVPGGLEPADANAIAALVLP